MRPFKFLKLPFVIFRYLMFLQNVGKFKYFGKGSYIKSALKIIGYNNISIGKNVFINYKTSLAAVQKTGYPEPILEIHDFCIIGNFNHIYATKKIVIGFKVLTADKVYISDNLHEYENVNIPILDQPIKQNSEVIIGNGTWIGENACILGAKIGKNCVVGANTVVTNDIPDYCVVVGTPGRIIKRFNVELQTWMKTLPDGSFL